MHHAAWTSPSFVDTLDRKEVSGGPVDVEN
jgi:hypothetical protein